MAKLYFFYGVMGSSKTANALMTCYNYDQKGKKILFAKPEIDTRDTKDGKRVAWSRIGIQRECITLKELQAMFEDETKNCAKEYDAIIIDEIQFAKKEQIDFLSEIVDNYNIPVLCYGLRTDFKNEPFEGSLRLLSIADCIVEIKTICWCGNKAVCNARYNEKGIVRNGKQLLLGANDKYVGLCRKHYKLGILSLEQENVLKNIEYTYIVEGYDKDNDVYEEYAIVNDYNEALIVAKNMAKKINDGSLKRMCSDGLFEPIDWIEVNNKDRSINYWQSC